ncbi:hypothetical protein [Alkalitalea saponilacus]|uniref:Uncharacterized protein n=1 Tax=Alkalitalea saponilacus TaxID=889453 RepID=A0A1T5E129_9BACT|nr:hypothetical protein [Alkalitalea saponilacus]ASB49133.1 mannosyltransferase [Alkalitalea saponilacus]SKB77480.1 hypothetical protein SAMN03080601_01180 [Alkalitalea saponilacus]
MDKRFLHIVSFTVPWPPDYGGAMDVFYKVKALSERGVKVILHCFTYSRKQTVELEKYCHEVCYYKRETGFTRQFSWIPYIVKSRQNKKLIDRLKEDNHPILLEGTHTTAVLQFSELQNRDIWIRMHNVETDYYRSLCKTEKSFFKKLFFRLETLRLKAWEKGPFKVKGIIPISEGDADFFRKVHENVHLITAFHGETEVKSKTGIGKYVLYHGDLSVAENHCSALFVLRICSEAGVPLVIAGKNPSRALAKKVLEVETCQLIRNLDAAGMNELISNAAAILLPAYQTTGLRLKLLVSLFRGRHCIASPQMVENTGLEPLCEVVSKDAEWIAAIQKSISTVFSQNEVDKRNQLLIPFMDAANADRMIQLIFGTH